jgi:hypothetical protein
MVGASNEAGNVPQGIARHTQSHLQSQWNDDSHRPRIHCKLERAEAISASNVMWRLLTRRALTYRQDYDIPTFQLYILTQLCAFFVRIWVDRRLA